MKTLEQQILDQKGCNIILTRELAGGADELAKYKKSKPKGVNNSDLVKLKVKGWLDLSELAKPGQ